jgi:hypothetical protein
MPVWKMQCAFGADSGAARDRLVITPHFNDSGVGSDPQALCNDLCAALAGYASAGREVTVKAYDAQGTAPVYPQGEAQANVGSYPSGVHPREIACCLSFFSVRNIKRQRGRLYVPHAITNESLSIRPNSGYRAKIMSLGPIFEQLGGADVDWVVYSRLDNVARPVTHYWVDDEWDTIRSRGMRGTTRDIATTSEA